MRKFKGFPQCTLQFRSLLILAGALLLLAAFAPTASAQSLIAYYNFEDAATDAQPDFTSEAIAFFGVGSPNGDRPITTNYNPNGMTTLGIGLPQNLFPGDPDTNVHSMGLSRSGDNTPANFNVNLNTSQGFFSNMTVSFAINAQGNGFNLADIQFSTNGGGTFTSAGTTAIPSSGTIIVSKVLPAAANNTPLLIVRIVLSGGQSNGADLQNIVDNIRIEGTIVPEPATVAGGLLGVLGLCWFQRRRLIRSVRFRRT